MKKSECEQIEFTIFIAGDYGRAVHICEEFCLRGFCVTCEPTKYIYTMGREDGVRVGVINYARFPKTPNELKEAVFELAGKLLIGLNQGSYTVSGDGKSTFVSRRSEDLNS